MTQEIPKVYHPSEVEQKWYKFWEENNLFSPNHLSTQLPFIIVIPPPNVTGSLHMGHALNNILQDILIRYKRMQGFKVLWLPGTDHAGIATQNVVEKELKKEGKRKEDLGKEKFLETIWQWKEKYGGQILEQLKRLGCSCDWSRTRFTMDEGLSNAVKKAFLVLYEEGLIYKGKRLINWCPRCQTALSDIEVEYETIKGKLWYIKYGLVTVATTRPETMLGDTAVAVNPHDERYKHLVGKMLILPLVGRYIPVIKDEVVDPSFGTGAVKVTPAHDPNDFEISARHNLPQINILYPSGKIHIEHLEEPEKSNLAKYEGLDRFKARDLIVEDLKAGGYLEKIEDYETRVGHCYRCKTIVEPYLSDQWFVKVKPLAEKAIEAVEEGKIRFVPERWTKVYLNWMVNLRDWCISRQIWWGHKIPLEGEEDVLDTWFSSALWPFSTLGWPEETDDLKTYYPTSVLITGYDIITFWVSRMIMMGLHFTKQVPFHTVYVHGLVRDITGKKMSKSLGNVIDPVEVINHVGADALRFALTSLITGQGQDIKLSEDKIKEARNFANKIWNASRFVAMTKSQILNPKQILNSKSQIPNNLELADRWILSRYNYRIRQVTQLLEDYDFGEAARSLYEFIWSEFCDWYLEVAKIRIYGQDEKAKEEVLSILLSILEGTLRLLHPFMPFITEEVWQILNPKSEILNKSKIQNSKSQTSLVLQEWPKVDEGLINEKSEEQMNYLREVIRQIRNLRKEKNVPPKDEIQVEIQVSDKKKKEILEIGRVYILKLAKALEIEVRIEKTDRIEIKS